MTEVTVEDRGRVVIPKEIRDSMDIRGGEKLSVRREDGRIVLSRKEDAESVKGLKGCVESSDFGPMEAKEMWKE